MTMRPNADVDLRDVPGPGMRFVLVNERSPRADAHCAVCCWMSRPARTRDARRVS
jgi:hypothetical protein